MASQLESGVSEGLNPQDEKHRLNQINNILIELKAKENLS